MVITLALLACFAIFTGVDLDSLISMPERGKSTLNGSRGIHNPFIVLQVPNFYATVYSSASLQG